MEIKWHQENEPGMQVNTRKGVTYLTYPEFDKLPGFVHAFSTRLGGVSEGIYSSMNLSFTRGDRDEAVRENYRKMADAVGFDVKDIVTSDQTHTANVRLVTEEDRGNGITKPRPYTDVDGMITNIPGLVLARGLCASVFYRSGAPRDRTFSFRMERDGGEDRCCYSSKDAGRIWFRSVRDLQCGRSVYLSGLL